MRDKLSLAGVLKKLIEIGIFLAEKWMFMIVIDSTVIWSTNSYCGFVSLLSCDSWCCGLNDWIEFYCNSSEWSSLNLQDLWFESCRLSWVGSITGSNGLMLVCWEFMYWTYGMWRIADWYGGNLLVDNFRVWSEAVMG